MNRFRRLFAGLLATLLLGLAPVARAQDKIRLGITEATVKVHLKTLLRKVDVNNRTQAAIWAMNNGFSAEGAPIRGPHAVAA